MIHYVDTKCCDICERKRSLKHFDSAVGSFRWQRSCIPGAILLFLFLRRITNQTKTLISCSQRSDVRVQKPATQQISLQIWPSGSQWKNAEQRLTETNCLLLWWLHYCLIVNLLWSNTRTCTPLVCVWLFAFTLILLIGGFVGSVLIWWWCDSLSTVYMLYK